MDGAHAGRESLSGKLKLKADGSKGARFLEFIGRCADSGAGDIGRLRKVGVAWNE